MLEYFPSLRSPYTAVGHAAVEAMVERSKVALHLRPVMPMLMRGVTAPRQKQQFIMVDSVREAQAKNVAFGNFVDPFGEPVRRGFALFPGAQAQGKGLAFIGAYLNAAFAEGIDIDSKRGLLARSSPTLVWIGRRRSITPTTPTGKVYWTLTLMPCLVQDYGVFRAFASAVLASLIFVVGVKTEFGE